MGHEVGMVSIPSSKMLANSKRAAVSGFETLLNIAAASPPMYVTL
jgi:hypothetical protein